MLFSCSKNEDRMCRGFLKGLEEGVEGSLREHMHLVDDVHAVSSHLRRYAHLIHEGLDILDAVVRSSIELMDAVRASFGEGLARLALSAWLHLR